jgi:excinuclease ABC subunit A
MRKPIEITGARENNLQNIDVEFKRDQVTVVTGVSGSGKSSLVFDTVYHEARRRFLEIFSLGSSVKLAPAAVESISGLGPSIAVGQNLLNRNPLSTVATASGLHPFLRLLYSNFGERFCPACGAKVLVLTEDEIVDTIVRKAKQHSIAILAPLVHHVEGSHKTLLKLLIREFGDKVLVDGHSWTSVALDPRIPHDITIKIAELSGDLPAQTVREIVQQIFSLGSYAVAIQAKDEKILLSCTSLCVNCGTWIRTVEPKHFHMVCSHCEGRGCDHCQGTGLHPQAAAVRWHNLRLPDLLALSIDDARHLFVDADLPESAWRLETEIKKRLDALHTVGLGYIALDRSSPTLSRGEAQRVRLAVALTSRLEDMVHVLDEPTIGQHPYDVQRVLPAFRELPGPVIFVEHDRMAAAEADYVIDLGPGAGGNGGRVIFEGVPHNLWNADTPTGRYFSFKEEVKLPERRKEPRKFLMIKGAHLRNLKDIDVPIPLGRLTVITGVSGSGKSTFIDVLVPSLEDGSPKGCTFIEGPVLKPVLVDQSPIGRNPRSNPATYTKLSDIIRELFANGTGLTPSHFSFNRPEGRCPVCKGMGAIEVKMRYLPSTWIFCERCKGRRFSDEVLSAEMAFDDRSLSIADFYTLSIDEVIPLLTKDRRLSEKSRTRAKRILEALRDVGLGYLLLGQPSPTLSGGEAQRVKLAKYLGTRLSDKVLILDEPSTGLHPQDISGLVMVLDRLVRAGGTVVIVEHNTDIIRAADWVLDLGPGAGLQGGHLLFAGTPEELRESETSMTGQALRNELLIEPRKSGKNQETSSEMISIRGANAHNLKNVSVNIPKNTVTVITGVSGSGKSSLISDVLEAEARRRFLESLSMYERQSIKEGPEAPVETISGLGVAVSVDASRKRYSRRSTIGKETEITHHLTVLLAYLGERKCLKCGTMMVRTMKTWVCPHCYFEERIASPSEFLPSAWLSACPKCQGIGTISIPNPEKLIVAPDSPLCGGAMYSPGFFPFGYMCKPPNIYYSLRALGNKYGFDPEKTPWNQMTPEAQHAFLFGDPEPLEIYHKDGKGRTGVYHRPFRGFYQLIGDWDLFGTYVDIEPCPECRGATLRPEFLAQTLQSFTIHELGELSLEELEKILREIPTSSKEFRLVEFNYNTLIKRLHFLIQVGLGYINLNRITATLSAGEAERIKLAGILGSNLTSLTLLLDEPSRGLHPSEVQALLEALTSLRDEGNTVVVVEHDPVMIRAADHLIDLGPGAGTSGGEVVAEGTPAEVAQTDTVTGLWLRGERRTAPFADTAQKKLISARRSPKGFMTIRGARAHNLKGESVDIPLGILVGVCGVSGSGKSTLFIDTLGRALVPKKHTTSVAYEPLTPGEHDSIDGAPDRAILVDQTKKGIYSPVKFFGLKSVLEKVYCESEDAKALGIDEKKLKRPCSVCNGDGIIKMDMGFLPAVRFACDACEGTGYSAEAWDVHLRGYALPELLNLTIDQVFELFEDNERIARPLQAARDVGLGYLVLQQPAYSLSGGEAQRLKIAKELCRKTRNRSVYILDEPTVGQHLEDVERLINVLQALAATGHTVIVIEHHPHVLAACDWLIELGPSGGPEGGYVIAAGAPEKVAFGKTPTAQYIREVVEGIP